MGRFLSFILTLLPFLAVSAASYEAFDAIIVGGGPAGFVLASRLSEKPDFKVLLLENGPDTYPNSNITTPAFHYRLLGSAFLWNFTTTPQAALDGVTPSLGQGNGFGGGTAVNVMVYCRGASSVFDEWAEISGIDELRWDNFIKYFRMSSQLTVPSDLGYDQVINATGFGKGGVHVSYENSQQYLPIDTAFVKTWTANGAENVDVTAGHGIGMTVGGPHSINPTNATRSYALPAFGFELARRPNVKLLHSARVVKINFDGNKAVGVDYVTLADNQTHTVLANETIITAGAINTPRLLLLSGVGPKDHLAEVGIPLVVDSPGVGENLFDHPLVVTVFNATPDITTFSNFNDPATLASFLAEYRENATGPLSTPGSSSFFAERLSDEVLDSFGVNVSFHKSLPKDRPHLLYQYDTNSFLPVPDGSNGVSAFAGLVQPESSGSVRLQSTNWRDDPLLDPNYFGSPADLAIAMYGYRRLLTMMRSDTMASVNAGELYPGRNVTSDADLKAALNTATFTFHHPVGTCALGSVLDEGFSVRGTRGLRVVGSAAMPRLPTCHTQSSVYALAEFAALGFRGESGV